MKGVFCELPLSHTLANVAAFKAQAGDSEEGGRFVCVEGGVWGGGGGERRQAEAYVSMCQHARGVDLRGKETGRAEKEKRDLFVSFFCMWRLSRAPDVPRVD